MANRLDVDASGLRAAATSSDFAATALFGAELGSTAGSRSSDAGIAAMNAALASVRSRQFARVTDQANDMSVGGARYDTTDGVSADATTAVRL